MRRIPEPLWSRIEKSSGVEDVTEVMTVVWFGCPITSEVTGAGSTLICFVALFVRASVSLTSRHMVWVPKEAY